MRAMKQQEGVEDALYSISSVRLKHAMSYVFSGFEVDPDEALELIKNDDESTLEEDDIEKKKRLIAALYNLADFAAAEEYQLYSDVQEAGVDGWDEERLEMMSEYLVLNNRYNHVYATVENGDIEYSLAMAAIWIRWHNNTTITYWTQNDDRVRPWHYVLHGFSAKKSEFPDWMIPPIEWGCRCYLVHSVEDKALDIAKVMAKTKVPEKPENLSGVFKESICNCGRIFSDEHPYFEIEEKDVELVSNVVSKLLAEYYEA